MDKKISASDEATKKNEEIISSLTQALKEFIGFVLVLVFLAPIFCLLFGQIFNVPKLEAKYKKALSVEEKIESDILNLESKMHIVKISNHETDIYGSDEQIELYNSLQIARQKAIEKRRKAEDELFDAERIINKWKGYKLYKKYTELGSGEDK
ncbi:MAG: hypothetical protein IJ158_05310 [Treponema sp.]|nr:hypothetical protein [Treponema sp.]